MVGFGRFRPMAGPARAALPAAGRVPARRGVAPGACRRHPGACRAAAGHGGRRVPRNGGRVLRAPGRGRGAAAARGCGDIRGRAAVVGEFRRVRGCRGAAAAPAGRGSAGHRPVHVVSGGRAASAVLWRAGARFAGRERAGPARSAVVADRGRVASDPVRAADDRGGPDRRLRRCAGGAVAARPRAAAAAGAGVLSFVSGFDRGLRFSSRRGARGCRRDHGGGGGAGAGRVLRLRDAGRAQPDRAGHVRRAAAGVRVRGGRGTGRGHRGHGARRFVVAWGRCPGVAAGFAEPGCDRGGIGVEAAMGRAADRVDPGRGRSAARGAGRAEGRAEPGNVGRRAGVRGGVAGRGYPVVARRAPLGAGAAAGSPGLDGRRTAARVAGSGRAFGRAVAVGAAAGARRGGGRARGVAARGRGSAGFGGMRVRGAPGVRPALVRRAPGHVVARGGAAGRGLGSPLREPGRRPGLVMCRGCGRGGARRRAGSRRCRAGGRRRGSRRSAR